MFCGRDGNVLPSSLSPSFIFWTQQTAWMEISCELMNLLKIIIVKKLFIFSFFLLQDESSEKRKNSFISGKCGRRIMKAKFKSETTLTRAFNKAFLRLHCCYVMAHFFYYKRFTGFLSFRESQQRTAGMKKLLRALRRHNKLPLTNDFTSPSFSFLTLWREIVIKENKFSTLSLDLDHFS